MQSRQHSQVIGLDTMAARLEPVMTKLAKACLTSKPDDVDQFCYDFFSARLGKEGRMDTKRKATRKSQDAMPIAVSAVDDDLDYEETKEQAEVTVAQICAKKRQSSNPQKTYESSDEDEKYQTESSDEVSSSYMDPMGDKNAQFSKKRSSSIGRVVSVEPASSSHHEIQFGGELPPEEEAKLQIKITEASKDPRMKILFDIWDADGSGDVDLMELVMALHKFNRVMEEGTDLKRASDALICAESTSSSQICELNLQEFTRLVVQFCDEAYKKPFSEMADHLIAVAKSTSERAALAAASGEDVAYLEQRDNEEIEVLKATLLGFENSVVKNIEKIKSERRVKFK